MCAMNNGCSIVMWSILDESRTPDNIVSGVYIEDSFGRWLYSGSGTSQYRGIRSDGTLKKIVETVTYCTLYDEYAYERPGEYGLQLLDTDNDEKCVLSICQREGKEGLLMWS